MSFLEIPVGPASVFVLILIGYFVMTVWFGSPQPIVTKSQQPSPETPKPPRSEEPRELTAS